jgi:HEAT repeat protein
MPQTEQQFLSDLQSDNADVRFAAWRRAGDVNPSVIPELGKLAASGQPGVAKAAHEALNTLVHAVGREDSPRRAEVVSALLDLTGGSSPIPVRTQAFRLLSLVAGDDAVARIAKSVQEPAVREEAVFCLERLPGGAATRALIAAYKESKDDFKPRILEALGHRRAEEAAGLCVEAIRSPKKEIAVAGIRAFGRIGKKPSEAAVRFAEPAGLSDWQKIDRLDSILRYADAQVKQGSHAEAMKLYKIALERPEEHWQCAAMIGIAKIGTADAAAAIFPKLSSSNRVVRLTAENVWKGMAVEARKKG